VHHSLLIAAQVIRKIRILLQRLSDARDISMSKNPKASRKKSISAAIALHELRLQKSYDGLRSGQPLRHLSTSINLGRWLTMLITLNVSPERSRAMSEAMGSAKSKYLVFRSQPQDFPRPLSTEAHK
jgi:hypothetical protein